MLSPATRALRRLAAAATFFGLAALLPGCAGGPSSSDPLGGIESWTNAGGTPSLVAGAAQENDSEPAAPEEQDPGGGESETSGSDGDEQGSFSDVRLVATPDRLDFGSERTQMTFVLRNVGARMATYTIRPGAAWLSTRPDTGVNWGEEDVITVLVDRSKLPDGGQSARLEVVAEGGAMVGVLAVATGGSGGDAPGIQRISGYVREGQRGLKGVTVVASRGGSSALSGGDGYYVVEVPTGWSGTLTPTHTEYWFSPPSYALVNIDGPLYGVNFEAHPFDPDKPAFFSGLDALVGSNLNARALGVSAYGTAICGTVRDGTTHVLTAFRWTAKEGRRDLGYLPQGRSYSIAFSASDDGGTIVGQGLSQVGFEAFRWTPSTGMIALGDLPGGAVNAAAYAVSGNGLVVVGCGASNKGREAFRWSPLDGWTPLGDLAGGRFESAARGVSFDGSVVVGYGTREAGPEAFAWTAGTGLVGLGFLPGGDASAARAVSRNGRAVVGWSKSDAGTLAFRWTELEGMSSLGDLPGGDAYSSATDVSFDGGIVVGTSSTSNGMEAFIWDAYSGMRPVQTVLTAKYGLNLSGWRLTTVQAVSADGRTLVGTGINPFGRLESWVAYMP
jgi:probable HAF family extracellular repeat protein